MLSQSVKHAREWMDKSGINTTAKATELLGNSRNYSKLLENCQTYSNMVQIT